MDDEAFARAIVALTDTLYRVSSSQLRQRADQEDAVQECLRRAWEKRRTLREERYLKTWLIRILINECHRIQGRMKRVAPQDEVPVISRDHPSYLRDAFVSVPEKYRLPMLLHYVEGMSVAETAQALHIPQGTVKSRLARGRKALGEILNEEVLET